MRRRVLLSVYEAPGFGGASTDFYGLHAKLLRDGVDSHLVLGIPRHDVPFYRAVFGDSYANPQRLDNVLVHEIDAGNPGPSGESLAGILAAVGPDIALCRGHVAARAFADAATDTPFVYFLGSVPETSALSRHRTGEAVEAVRRYRERPHKPAPLHAGEMQAMQRSRLLVANSPLVADACRAFLPYWLSVRLYPHALTSAEWVVDEVHRLGVAPLSFADRDIDLLLVASSWRRWEKNFDMVQRLVGRCGDLDIHIVGDCPGELTGVTHSGFEPDRRRLVGLMARSKALVCPSLVDAEPGVLFEAAAMGCNVVASKNCGNWRLCDPSLLVDPLSDGGLAEASRCATRRAYPGHLDEFRGSGAYVRLKEVLEFL